MFDTAMGPDTGEVTKPKRRSCNVASQTNRKVFRIDEMSVSSTGGVSLGTNVKSCMPVCM